MRRWIVWLCGVGVLFAAVRYVDVHKESLALSGAWVTASMVWFVYGLLLVARAAWRLVRS